MAQEQDSPEQIGNLIDQSLGEITKRTSAELKVMEEAKERMISSVSISTVLGYRIKYMVVDFFRKGK